MENFTLLSVLTLAATVFAGNSILAQVNINLTDVITIDEGNVAIGGLDELNYKTAVEYQTANVPSRLIITSTKRFGIDVHSTGVNYENGKEVTALSALTTQPVTDDSRLKNGYTSNLVLSASNKELISSGNYAQTLTYTVIVL